MTARYPLVLNGTTLQELQTSDSLGSLISTGVFETKTAISALDIDLSLGTCFTKTLTATSITFTVSNIPATGILGAFMLDLTNAGLATITWTLSVAAGGTSSVKWVGGTTPTALTSSGRDSFIFYTYDAGATWTGLLVGKDIK
jgi:hypothetical protein